MPTSTATILVVDDSPTALRTTSDSLTARGYHVVTAADGQTALQLVPETQPDLIVLDIILPKINGFHVCRKLKSDPATAGIKILLLSSKSQASDKFWGQKQGADAYITKPYENTELFQDIEQLLGPAPGQQPAGGLQFAREIPGP